MSALSWRLENDLDAAARAELGDLWRGDPQRNPFTAPAFLRVMQERPPEAGSPLWALGTARNGSLAAAWPLRVTPSGGIRFLASDYSDQRTCLALAEVAPGMLAEGLECAIRGTRARTIALANIPPWGPTLAAVREALRRMGWAHRAFAAWPCPVLRVSCTAEPGAALRAAIEQHKRVRGYANALRREPGFAFEVAESDVDLDAWCEDFCRLHVERWADTGTPSAYAAPAARARLRAVLGAWHEDGVLVRFAVRDAAGRTALVAALRAERRLIYYHVVTSPRAERSRAGHVLIRLIGLWMSERGFDTLDFGAGGEDYKFRYANADEKLWRVFGARRVISPQYLRALVEERIRRSPALQRGWDAVVNRRLRGSWRRRIAAFAARAGFGGGP